MGNFDVCVIGSGPVGIATALECVSRGKSVALIESARPGPLDVTAQALAEFDIIDPSHHNTSDLTLRRAFGGTSLIWAGRCVPYDEVDFNPRPWVTNHGWPIGQDEVEKYYAAAATYLDCGSATFWKNPTISGAVTNSNLERWTRQKNAALANRERLAAARGVSVHTGLTVLDIILNRTGEAASTVHCVGTLTGEPVLVEADKIVLAMGGVENTRLLLHIQRRWPLKFGGTDGPLGRYYQGHLFGRIADIQFTNGHEQDFDFFLDETNTYVRRRFTLSGAEQHRQELLNICFLPDAPLFYEHRWEDGALSALFLAMSIPALGRRLLPEAMRLQQIGPKPRKYWPHVANVMRSPVATATSLVRIAHQRFGRPVSKPGLFSGKNGAYQLYFHAEHAPNPRSRVTLSDQCDALGMHRARIDFRFSRIDIESVVKSHVVLDTHLRGLGIGELRFYEGNPDDAVRRQAKDGFHQIGLTRMSMLPCDGIVDTNCKVHDLANVYVAGSSVFPTSGQANPTFMAVALGVRLARSL